MLEINELGELLEKIHNKIDIEITQANIMGEDELLKILNKYGFEEEAQNYNYIDLNYSKILIVGDLSVKKKDIQGICKSMKIDFDRIDFVDYDEATNYNFGRLKYSDKYSDIIIGPVPHKAMGIGNNSSIIAMFENDKESYPKVILSKDSNELKLTKTSLKEAFKKTRIYNQI